MYFFRPITLVLALLVQPTLMLAEVTEMDVLDSPSVSVDTKTVPLSSSHQISETPVPDKQNPFVTPLPKKKAVNAYPLDVGDKIEIKVFGQDDLSLSTRLDESGVINYQFLGEIPAVGMTTTELEQLITSGLKRGYLVSPHVNVSIVEYRPFYIKGQVKNPGSYPYQPGLTLAKAITIAGGFSEFATENHIMVVRGENKKQRNLRIFLQEIVYPGDTITVNESMFYIDGEVNNPGKYPLHGALTVREAISLAGGLTERASVDDIYTKTGKGARIKVGRDSEVRSGSSIIIEQSFF